MSSFKMVDDRVELARRLEALIEVNAELLETSRRQEKDDLAREGYRFYAKEAEEFAVQSAAAVGEAFDEDGPRVSAEPQWIKTVGLG